MRRTAAFKAHPQATFFNWAHGLPCWLRLLRCTRDSKQWVWCEGRRGPCRLASGTRSGLQARPAAQRPSRLTLRQPPSIRYVSVPVGFASCVAEETQGKELSAKISWEPAGWPVLRAVSELGQVILLYWQNRWDSSIRGSSSNSDLHLGAWLSLQTSPPA